jgi:hypothetical protein
MLHLRFYATVFDQLGVEPPNSKLNLFSSVDALSIVETAYWAAFSTFCEYIVKIKNQLWWGRQCSWVHIYPENIHHQFFST